MHQIMEYNLIAKQYHIINDIGFMKGSTRHFIINLSAYSIRPINNGPTKTHKSNGGWQNLLSPDTKTSIATRAHAVSSLEYLFVAPAVEVH